jgi:ArsR family transcriptional regulator
MELTLSQQVLVYKAFCDEQRLQIIDHLTYGERCACELLDKLDIKQSTLSHHMHLLVESGLVLARKESKWIYYTLNENACTLASDQLRRLMTKKFEQAVSCDCETQA